MQRVHEKKLADSLTSAALIDSEAAEQRSRHHGIARKFPGHIGWQLLQFNAEGRERVVAEDGFGGCWCDSNKGRSDKTARVLTGNLFQVTVKNFVAAGESFPVMLPAKRLDNPRRFGECGRHLFAAIPLVTPRRFAQTGPRRGRLEKRGDEDLPSAVAQSQSLMFP
jgi:hypothetical protein